MILSESLCLGVFVAEKDLSEWAQLYILLASNGAFYLSTSILPQY